MVESPLQTCFVWFGGMEGLQRCHRRHRPVREMGLVLCFMEVIPFWRRKMLFCFVCKTKKPYPNSLGQDFHPAVPPKLTPKRPLDPETIISAATGNGCGPRQKLLTMRRSPCPHKSIHRKVLCRELTIHGSLKGCLAGYSSCSTVCWCLIALHYMRPAVICQPLF